MAIDADDWTIDRDTGDIRYTGDDHGGASPSYATVIELHRWVQGLADDAVATAGTGDELDITNTNPSVRSTDNIITLINGYNIDDGASEHLYDGSIVQDDGDTIYDGIVNFGVSTVQIQIIQDGAVLSDDWWNYGGGGLNADANQGISHRFMIKVRMNGVDIDGRKLIGTSRTFGNTYHEFKINSTNRGNNVLALSDSDDLNNETVEGTVSGWTTITNTEGLRDIDVNNDGSTEEYYSEWDKDTYTINQFYERMKWLSRDGSSSTLNGLNGELFRGITHSFAYDNETGGAPSTNDEYAWGTLLDYDNESNGPFVVGDYLAETSATPLWKARVLAVDDDGATGNLIVVVETGGTISEDDSFTTMRGASETTADVDASFSQISGGGVIRFFAIHDDGTSGALYGQLMKGTAPSDDIRLYDDLDVGKYLDVNGAVTERTISTPFCGQSTGSAIIGAYGFCLEYADLAATDKVFDLTNTQRTPPNNVQQTVSGLASGEDRVLVAPWDGTTYDDENKPVIDKDQLSLNTALTIDPVTSVIVDEAAPHGTPNTGYIRVTDNNGFERRLHYTGFTGTGPTTFTIDTSDGNEDFSVVNASIGNDVYIAYIDELASSGTATYTAVHTSGTDDLVVIVRDGGSSPIKEFKQAWTFTSTPQTISAIRQSDE